MWAPWSYGADDSTQTDGGLGEGRRSSAEGIADLSVVRGKVGGYLDANRVRLSWTILEDGMPFPDDPTGKAQEVEGEALRRSAGSSFSGPKARSTQRWPISRVASETDRRRSVPSAGVRASWPAQGIGAINILKVCQVDFRDPGDGIRRKHGVWRWNPLKTARKPPIQNRSQAKLEATFGWQRSSVRDWQPTTNV
jgi:hypothetical protein